MSRREESRHLRATVRGTVETLAIVLGDQLDARAAALDGLDRRRDAVLMMEVAGEATDPPSHRQRTVLFLAAMRHFALDLQDRGWRVRYVKLGARDNTGSLDDEVRRTVEVLAPRRVTLVQPGDRRLDAVARRWREVLPRAHPALRDVAILEDTHFTCSREDFAAWADGRKRLVMEHFYRRQRRRLGILIDADGDPVGGRWNFDAENREAFGEAPAVRRPYTPRTDGVTREVIDDVARHLPDLPGRLETFRWPVTRDQARRALADFVAHRLPAFGTYQDAMWSGEPFLHHSLLASALNLKLLGVRETVDAALAALDGGDAPLNAVEGFVRQIIGWREFVRGIYWHEGPDYRDRNALGHDGDLPACYWTGDTDLACLADAVGQVLDHGYGHHIQRLMVTGNLALTAGCSPQQVNAWYLGMYVDAVDWVTTPNVVGMALHADGGVVGSKPYAASGRYIARMSNHCDGCRYDPARRADADGGRPACPFTVFYWDFLQRHRRRFSAHPRMRMILKHLEAMPAAERRAVAATAERLRRELGITPT